jgi:hypothetical protein
MELAPLNENNLLFEAPKLLNPNTKKHQLRVEVIDTGIGIS